MNDALPDELSQTGPVYDRHASFEQQIFAFSPFGLLVTSILIFVIFMTSLAVALSISDVAIFTSVNGKFAIAHLGLLGGWFCLMNAVALAMQRYSRLKDRDEAGAFALVLRDGKSSVARLMALTPKGASLTFATLLGLVVGVVASWVLYVGGSDNLSAAPLLAAWFFLSTTFIITLFTRGVALTRSANRSIRAVLDSELIIDLMRVDKLSVVGRSAARGAMIWFTVSAVMFLGLIDGGFTTFSIALVFGSCAIGAWSFLSPMEHIHLKIRAAKAAELEKLRTEIDTVRPLCTTNDLASQRLQGLLAFEQRIMAAPEWPFDQPTLLRVFASPLILTLPWFGQAIAATLVEHMGHILG